MPPKIISKKEINFLQEVIVAHKREFEEEPEVIIAVPQPTTIIGSFSDYIKGWSLICNIEDGLTVAISRRQDTTVRLLNANKQDKKKFVVASSKYRKEDKWANAAKAIFSTLNKQGLKVCGCNITLAGRGASTSNYSISSEIFAALLFGLNKLFSLSFDTNRLFSIALSASSFFPSSCVRYRDLWILFFAEKDKVYLFDEKKQNAKGTSYSIKPELSYIFDSSLPYSILTPEYDEFRSILPELVEKINEITPKGTEFRDLTEKEVRCYTSSLPDRTRRFITFLSLSSEYAKRAFEAISRSEGIALGKILSLSQRSIIFNAELTSPELDWIFRRCQESVSVIGMASIDIGIASSFLCIVDEKSEFPNNQRVEEYERIFGFHPEKRPFHPVSSLFSE